MKKIAYVIVGILLIGSIATVGIKAAPEKTVLDVNITFSTLAITEEKEYTTGNFIGIEYSGAEGVLYNAGAPMLPVYRKTLSLPFGTKIVNINCITDEIKTMSLTGKIIPAPQPVVSGISNNNPVEYTIDETIYKSNELFPSNWIDFTTGGGLDAQNEHVTFLTIQVFPVRYNPVANTINYVEKVDLTITYDAPDHNLLPTNSESDLVIITPSTFTSELQRLVTHKNSMGINTIIKTTEEIYSQYTGVDKPEKIKYFIKDAIETLGIKYVLLVGGIKYSGFFGKSRDDANQASKDWYMPVRYTNNDEGGTTHDPGFISDLYFADIYDSEGNFSSWDTNNDGIFAYMKGGSFKNDNKIDLYPDVLVGRLACTSKKEVKIMVDKIITYETTTYGKSWYNNIIALGGDSHDDATKYYEGEVTTSYILETYMKSFTLTKLYASNKDIAPSYTPTTENIMSSISKGCGFILFDGHGNPLSWNTHWPGVFNWQDTPGGINCYDFPKLKNKDMYPIVVVGGCHNSMFNVTVARTIRNDPFMWTYGAPIPECFGWFFISQKSGGAIACMGNTGLGYGAIGNYSDVDGDGIDLPDTIEALGGYQELQFFKSIHDGAKYLGDAWGGTITNYLHTYPGMKDQTDCKTVEQWPLFGDPSLKIGGYET